MTLYFVFGVNVGNLNRKRTGRGRMLATISKANETLALHNPSTKIVG